MTTRTLLLTGLLALCACDLGYRPGETPEELEEAARRRTNAIDLVLACDTERTFAERVACLDQDRPRMTRAAQHLSRTAVELQQRVGRREITTAEAEAELDRVEAGYGQAFLAATEGMDLSPPRSSTVTVIQAPPFFMAPRLGF